MNARVPGRSDDPGRRVQRDSGAGLVEYSLLAGLVLLALVGSLSYLQSTGREEADRRAQGLVVDGTAAEPSDDGTVAGSTTTSIASSSTTTTNPPASTTTTVSSTTTTLAPPPSTTPPVAGPVSLATSARWNYWNWTPYSSTHQGEGTWVARLTLGNSAAHGGNVEVRTVPVRGDGTLGTATTRTFWVPAGAVSSHDIWDLRFVLGGPDGGNTVAILVEPLQIRLTNGTTVELSAGAGQLDRPALP